MMIRNTKARTALLASSAGLALSCAIALAPQQAAAQAFNASPTVVQGVVDIQNTSPGQTTVEVGTFDAIVDWQPIEDGAGNALDYLPAGNTAVFRNLSDPNTFGLPQNADFAILNRILPDTNGNPISINGTIVSELESSGVFVTGGNVAFYSPTGILVGATAMFDVGGLVLTTLDPGNTGFGDFAQGAPMTLITSPGSQAAIQIDAGAQIFAGEENSYAAFIAPQIIQNGDVNINGAIAYVAAEQAIVRHNMGLFDISITTGTTASTAIVHGGTSTGPGKISSTDEQVIYVTAAAKTNPIAMLIEGTLGFAPAQTAVVSNGEVILAANYDVSGKSVNNGTITDGINAVFGGRSETSDVAADIFVDNATVTSDFLAIGTDNTQVSASSANSNFLADVIIVGRDAASLFSSAGQTINVGGDLQISARGFGTFASGSDPNFDPDALGGFAVLDSFNGDISVIGDVLIAADAFAGVDTDILAAGSARAGQAGITADGGSIMIGGNATTSARAFAPLGSNFTSADFMDAGVAQMVASNAGTLDISASALIIADATGTDASGGGATGGDAFGANADLRAETGGAITIGDLVTLNASAIGGNGNATGVGGIGTAGTAIITADGPQSQITITNSANFESTGIGGQNSGGTGGVGTGGYGGVVVRGDGIVSIGGGVNSNVTGTGGNGIDGGDAFGGDGGGLFVEDFGSLSVTGTVTVDAGGDAGSASFGFGGSGGNAEGGTAFVQANGSDGGIATIQTGDIAFDISASGGTGGAADGNTIAAGAGGDASAGIFQGQELTGGAFVIAGRNNASLTTGNIDISANGFGGQGGPGSSTQVGGDGGSGTGGTAQLGHLLAATINNDLGATPISFGNVDVATNAFGGLAGSSSFGLGIGGDADGGFSLLRASVGALSVGTVAMSADAFAATGVAGGAATGGESILTTTVDGALTTAGDVSLSSVAFGGAGGANGGGVAFGGEAYVQALTGSISVQGAVTAMGSATGGNASQGFGGRGGDATGGAAFVEANAEGGPLARVDISGDIQLSVRANGGTGGAGDGGSIAAGAGGDGTAGRFETGSSNGAYIDTAEDNSFITGGNVNIDSDGSGGLGGAGGTGQSGGDGGNGFGGTSYLGMFRDGGDTGIGNSTIVLGNIDAATSGIGGDGGNGPAGRGLGGDGTGYVNDLLVTDGSFTSGVTQLFADGRGGHGSVGGLGTGGNVSIVAAVDGSQITATQLDGFAVGFGGTGESTFGGDGIGGEVLTSRSAALGTNNPNGVSSNSSFNGTLAVSGSLTFDASANGGGSGISQNIAGGDGFAGTAQLEATGGSITVTGAARVAAQASGGDGSSGASAIGGEGIGGLASIEAVGGDILLGSALVDSFAGGGDGGSAGDGSGGDALARINSGSDLTVSGDLFITADASGGQALDLGGVSGDGFGGRAEISASDGTASVTGVLTLSGNGIGGSAIGTDIPGGIGRGFVAELTAIDGAVLDLNIVQMDASGIGGNSDRGRGGDGFGGNTNVSVGDAGTSVTIANTALNAGNNARFSLFKASAFGGATGGSDGIGGAASAGDITVQITNNATLTLPLDPGSAPNTSPRIQIENAGFAGGSSVEGGTGGAAAGGSTSFIVDNSVLNSAELLFTPIGLGGSSLDSNANISGGGALNGDLSIVVRNGGVLNSPIQTTATRGGTASGTGTGGSAGGGTVTMLVDNATANLSGTSILQTQLIGGAGAQGGDANGGAADLTVRNGGILNILPDAGGDPGLLFVRDVVGSGDGTVRSGDATGGIADVTVLNATISGGTLAVDANANAASPNPGTSGAAIAGDPTAQFDTGANVTLDGLAVRADAFSSDGGSTQGGSAVLSVSNIGSGTDPLVDVGTIDLSASGDFADTSTAGDYVVEIIGSGLLRAGTVNTFASAEIAGPESFIFANGGTIQILDALNTTKTGDLTLEAINGGLILGGNSPTDPTALFDINASGTLTFIGDNDNLISIGAQNLFAFSSDVDIRPGSRIGGEIVEFGTREEGGFTVLGGDTEDGDYTLTAAEAERIEANSFTFNHEADFDGSSPSGPSGLEIRDVTIAGSLDDGVSDITINSVDTVTITGAIEYLDAAPTDSFSILAEDGIRIVLPTGSISMFDSNDTISGTVKLLSRSIFAADTDLIDQILLNPLDPAIDQALADDGGATVPSAYVVGGRVELVGVDYIYLQNTGADGVQVGVVASEAGGLRIAQPTLAELDEIDFEDDISGIFLRTVAFAAIESPSGTFQFDGDLFFINEDVLPLVELNQNPANHLTADATLNGCIIVTGECGSSGGTPTPSPGEGQSVIEESVPELTNPVSVLAPVEPAPTPTAETSPTDTAAAPVAEAEDAEDDEFGIDFPGLINSSTMVEDGLIDEPVASGGDAALYVGDDDGDDEEDDDDDKEEGAE